MNFEKWANQQAGDYALGSDDVILLVGSYKERYEDCDYEYIAYRINYSGDIQKEHVLMTRLLYRHNITTGEMEEITDLELIKSSVYEIIKQELRK